MPPERRAVLLLLGLAVGGQAIRSWVAHPGSAPGEVALVPSIPGGPGNASGHRDSAVALARPLAPGETINLDSATALEIARLPKVGPRLAKTIVADRAARGPFGSLAALDRVPGVGAGLLAAISSHATFGGSPDPPKASGSSDPLTGTPGGVPNVARQFAGPGGAPDSAPRAPLNLNTATAQELETLPFIGPGLALRIVAFREKHGPFPAVDSLVRVPGIGPSVLARVRDRVGIE